MSIGGIDTSRIEAMVAQLRAAAAQTKPAAQAAVPAEQTTQRVSFESMLKSSLDQVNEAQQQSTRLAQRFAMGDGTVSLSDAMISLQKSSIAFQQTVQVRNKLVAAYQEIMNMGV